MRPRRVVASQIWLDEKMLDAMSLLLPNRMKIVLTRMHDAIFDPYAVRSYSQEGEDMILRRMFEGQERGFYVDVGAHHPCRFSNTHFFYQRGWRGINIEPNPDAIRIFQAVRRRDTNLQIGVSDCAGKLVYYSFDEPALNTFSKDVAESRLATTPYKLVKTIDVPVERLDGVLRKYMPAKQEIDFISIDVEGLDFAVLRSNDWRLFRPKCVLVEALELSLREAMLSNIVLFMETNGYELFAKTFNTFLFRDHKA